MAHLRTCSVEQLERLAAKLVPALRQLVGAHVPYAPMYPNFPAQVMQASRAELYLNAILHYLTHGRPRYEKRRRTPLLERVDLRMIDLGDDADFRAICTTLLAAKSALSPADRADLTWFFQTYGDQAIPLIPREMPLRETVALLATLLLRHTTRGAAVLCRYIKTATDVLQLAVALSDGDVSLAAATRFRPLARAERRLLLERGSVALLCGCADPQRCHRRVAAAFLAERLGAEVEHILAPERPARPSDQLRSHSIPLAVILAPRPRSI